MNKSIWMVAGSTAALCTALIAAPGHTAASRAQEPGMPEVREFNFMTGEEGGSWLGVETLDVTGERAKELKLPAERGVVLGRIAPDSPASKAGLKENDVVVEINGQQVEGATQFRRMIREIPAGRSVQLTVWRDGRTEKVNVTLGQAQEFHHNTMRAAPGTFAFRLPDVGELGDLPEVREIPEMPEMGWTGNMLYAGHPRLGIDAEDLNGQLGSYFGAPEGEGILVRSVNSGSAAEKAGVKAGDVITSLNGERIRSVGDLRQKLSSREDDKDKDSKDRTVKLGVLRNKSEMSLSVEIPASPAKTKHIIQRRTNI
jgi:Trypsin-like serine proteases, typically periplasmic, contain C-terminal PDZ domain